MNSDLEFVLGGMLIGGLIGTVLAYGIAYLMKILD